MIWGVWRDPNYKFKATDQKGVVYEFFCYAETEQGLRERLRRKYLTVEWIVPYDFEEWRERARKATEKVKLAYQQGKKPINFRGKIWAELKWHLFELFKNKCAYCESRTQDVYYGDVEHYRPKGQVDEDVDHPGYYWLAYDVSNLLPSCAMCNQLHGKMTHFPVQGRHALTPEEIEQEDPLLLNPYNMAMDPCKHLEFSITGEALASNNSPYGEQSRFHYHLNRPGLGDSRLAALKQVEQEWSTLTLVVSSLTPFERYEIKQRDIKLSEREYSAASCVTSAGSSKKILAEVCRAEARSVPPPGKPFSCHPPSRSGRASGPGFDLLREKRLLLQPCPDVPERHQELTEDGMTHPAVGRDGKASRLGKVSIEVYGLGRRNFGTSRPSWSVTRSGESSG